jgi:hypothetical protein
MVPVGHDEGAVGVTIVALSLRKNEKKLRTNLFAAVKAAVILRNKGHPRLKTSLRAVLSGQSCFVGGESNETLHMFDGGFSGFGRSSRSARG